MRFFYDFRIYRVRTIRFFNGRTSGKINTRRTSHFFFCPVFVYVNVTFFGNVRPISFFYMICSTSSIRGGGRVLCFLHFFPTTMIPTFPIRGHGFSTNTTRSVPQHEATISSVHVIRYNGEHTCTMRGVLFFFGNRVEVFRPVFCHKTTIANSRMFKYRGFSLQGRPKTYLHNSNGSNSFRGGFHFQELFCRPISFVTMLSFSPGGNVVSFGSCVLLVQVTNSFFFHHLFCSFYVRSFPI